MTFTRTPAYRAAINQLADIIASMPIAELASGSVGFEVADDFDSALERRHRRFAEALSEASLAEYEQWRAERRKAGARKAAVTRAKAVASAFEAAAYNKARLQRTAIA